MKTYIVKSPLSISLWEGGGEFEINAIISFQVQPAIAATHEEPGSGPIVEVSKFQLSSTAGFDIVCPNWLSDRFENDDSFNAWLLQEAEERDQIERDMAAEEARDEEYWADRSAPDDSSYRRDMINAGRGHLLR